MSEARDVPCHRYAAHRTARYRGELLEMRFARYTAESCPVINFMSLLPIVECSYLTTRCAKLLYDIKDRQCGMQRPRLARVSCAHLSRFLSFSLYLHVRFAHAYSVTLEKRIIIRRTTNVGEAEFIVTSNFASVIFRRESSSRSRVDELSVLTYTSCRIF